MYLNKVKGLHSFEDLTKHIKTRIDDSHASPGARYYSPAIKFKQKLKRIISIKII
jgi:hypothetical protein